MMRHGLNRRIVTGATAVLLAAGASAAWGQTTGALATGRGWYSTGTALGDNQYGYSALSSGRYGSTGSALYSRIGDSYQGEVGRSSRYAGPRRSADQGMEDLAQPMRTTQRGGRGAAGSDELLGMGPSGMRDPLSESDRPPGQVLIVAQQYLETIGANTAAGVARGRTVTSFVPEIPGPFRDQMLQGQQALMAGGWKDVQRAVDAFSKAQLLSDRNPDVTISLAHAHFVVARYSYSLPSEYIQQTLILLPELPLVQMDPRTFFDSPATYDKRMAILASHLVERPGDPDALLVQAYFKWFEPGGAQAAADALRQAWLCSQKPRALGLGAMAMSELDVPGAKAGLPGQGSAPEASLRAAIEIFWKGMVKSGKVSGELDKSPTHGADSRPAGQSPVPAPKPPEPKKSSDAP